jgi:hypothetical protein
MNIRIFYDNLTGRHIDANTNIMNIDRVDRYLRITLNINPVSARLSAIVARTRYFIVLDDYIAEISRNGKFKPVIGSP